MNMQLLHEVGKKNLKKAPDLKPGSTVRVHQKIKEGEKERVQVFEGLIIAVSSGNGADKTFTVRKIVEGIGVEKVFPIHSPNIAKIQVKKTSNVRRSKLYYMRQRSGKSARLKEKHLTDEETNELDVKEEVKPVVVAETPVQEATKAPEAETKEV
jgi:large subunit ribosomal protein L19